MVEAHFCELTRPSLSLRNKKERSGEGHKEMSDFCPCSLSPGLFTNEGQHTTVGDLGKGHGGGIPASALGPQHDVGQVCLVILQ